MSLSLPDVDMLAWDKAGGLLPAIVQDAATGDVLMLAYMNRESLRETLQRGRVVFFSRSRQALWEKGETSGNSLLLVDIQADCDSDTLLVQARPAGPACHRGTPTCFGDGARREPSGLAFLEELDGVLTRRMADRPAGSYVARLLERGPRRIAQKVGEEGVEVALAAAAADVAELKSESADLLFHLMLLLKVHGLSLADVAAELAARHHDARR
ncbi:MAG: hypothetical protein RL026_2590 [Pseudomonadota bacterium]